MSVHVTDGRVRYLSGAWHRISDHVQEKLRLLSRRHYERAKSIVQRPNASADIVDFVRGDALMARRVKSDWFENWFLWKIGSWVVALEIEHSTVYSKLYELDHKVRIAGRVKYEAPRGIDGYLIGIREPGARPGDTDYIMRVVFPGHDPVVRTLKPNHLDNSSWRRIKISQPDW